MSERQVIVIGGGLAGIAASLECARGGARVTLLESRGRLGGAAYSFVRDGISADNGQHVFLRCCTAYRELLREIDAEDCVTLQPRLDIPVLAPGGVRARLRRSDLPAPLHMAGALARYPLLSASERWGVARAMQALRRVDPEDPAADRRSFGDWLLEHGQGPAAVDAIWDLIARPTLNLAPSDASLAQAAQVFRVGLLESASASDVGYARVPLSEIHDRAAARALARAGVEVHLRRGVSAVVPTDGGFTVEVARGPSLRAQAVILAVPPERLARLVPDGTGMDTEKLQRLGSSPIVNLHVMFDRRVTDVPFAAGVRTPVQWLFDRTQSGGLATGQYLAISLSAAEAELSMTAEDLRRRYVEALGDLLPAARSARVTGFFVTREHSATFRAAPGARALRPAAGTQLRGLAVAGAFTDTGWPATMEGAVRSGREAARHVLGSLGLGRAGQHPALRSQAGGPPGESAPDLLVLAPLGVEASAVRRGAPWARVHRTGMGPRRSARAAELPRAEPGSPVLIAGFCGALDPHLEPGDVILPTELRGPTGTTVCDDTTILAGALRRAGFRVHQGPIASSQRLVLGSRRRALARSGALAVDMESAWLASAVRGQPLVTLRVVMDTSEHELYRPLRTLAAFATAYRTLSRACELIEDWAGALNPRQVLLASPRASCAGVERAVEVVERALQERGAPIYVRKQIVHNRHVVAGLEQRGAVFVDELDEVPEGATVIFSAHGVSPAVRRQAGERHLDVIDATCPLVAKVHAEARRFAEDGFDIVLVGHEGHEEVEGTFGEAPERMHVIASPEEIADLEVEDAQRVAYLTQTTLAVDDTAGVIEALRARFPGLAGPASSDICYATQNRQDAVRALAGECDLILVVGSGNSSNSRRLVEVAERAGCPALLVEDGADIPPERLKGARRVGLTAGASAPEELVDGVIRALEGLGTVTVEERAVAREEIHFKLPREVRPER